MGDALRGHTALQTLDLRCELCFAPLCVRCAVVCWGVLLRVVCGGVVCVLMMRWAWWWCVLRR